MVWTRTVNDDLAAAEASEATKALIMQGFNFHKAVKKRQLGVAILRAAWEHFDLTVEHIHTRKVIHSTISFPSKWCFFFGVWLLPCCISAKTSCRLTSLQCSAQSSTRAKKYWVCYHNILIRQPETLLQSLNYKLRMPFLLTKSGPSLIITDGIAVVAIHLSWTKRSSSFFQFKWRLVSN